jgi:hypothetical protein
LVVAGLDPATCEDDALPTSLAKLAQALNIPCTKIEELIDDE